MKLKKGVMLLGSGERLVSVEVSVGEKIKFYSYTYQLRGRRGRWKPGARWDNLGQQPHTERYGEDGDIVQHIPGVKATFAGVEEVLKQHGRQLLSMQDAEFERCVRP